MVNGEVNSMEDRDGLYAAHFSYTGSSMENVWTYIIGMINVVPAVI